VPLYGPPNIEHLQAKHDVQGLIKALNYQKDQSIRAAAAQALGELGDARAISPLILTLQDQYPQVRLSAADALSKFSDPRVVEPLIKLLQSLSPDSEIRKIAALGLGNQKDSRAVAPLCKALNDPDWSVREAATEALDRLGWKPGKDSLGALYWINKGDFEQCVAMGTIALESLNSALKIANNDQKRKKIKIALIKIRENARDIKSLITAIADSDYDVRKAALEGLVRIGDPRAVEPLLVAKRQDKFYNDPIAQTLVRIVSANGVDVILPFLQVKDENIRRCAAYISGEVRNTRAVDALCFALKDTDQDVRKEAIIALGKIGDVRAVDPLCLTLKDTIEDVRKEAVITLGKIGDPRAVEPLIMLLKTEKYYIPVEIARALGRIGDSRAVQSLIAMLGDKEYVYLIDLHLAAIEALGQIGDSRAVEPLISALITWTKKWKSKKPQPSVKVGEALILTLEKIGDSSAVEPLLTLLQEGIPEIQGQVLAALGKIGDARAIEPLMIILADSQWSVRKAAAETLVELFHKGSLSKQDQQNILSRRDRITQNHSDEVKVTHSVSEALKNMDDHCIRTGYTDKYEKTHTDQGIGVDFPL
jgi:HEAT repeat protein